MTASIATQRLAVHLEHPAFVIVDVREMAAFNGWTLHGEARGGPIRGAVAFPLEWTAVVKGAALPCLFATKGITPLETTVHCPAPITDFGTTFPAHSEYLIGTEEANVLSYISDCHKEVSDVHSP